jgi:hypothetical protein
VLVLVGSRVLAGIGGAVGALIAGAVLSLVLAVGAAVSDAAAVCSGASFFLQAVSANGANKSAARVIFKFIMFS